MSSSEDENYVEESSSDAMEESEGADVTSPQQFAGLIRYYINALMQGEISVADMPFEIEGLDQLQDDDDDEDEDYEFDDEERGTATAGDPSKLKVETPGGTDLEHTIRVDSGKTSQHIPQNHLQLLSERSHSARSPPVWKTLMTQDYIPQFSRNWDRYRNQIFCGRFSRSGQVFMSACQDRVIRIYDYHSGKKTKEIQARNIGWSIIDTDYSPDQRWLIYSSWSEYIHLCNITGENNTHDALDMRPEDNRFCLFSVKFSPDSREILGGSSDRHIYIYNLERREVEMRIEGHRDDINTVTYAEEDNSNLIITGSDDRLCRVWDRRTMSDQRRTTAVGNFSGHSSGITHVSSKGDGRYFISNGKDHSLKLWDIRMGRPGIQAGRRADQVPDTSLMTYTGHSVSQTLIRAYFSPVQSTGARYIYSGSYNGNIYIWDVLTGEVVKKLEAHEATIRDLSWHPTEPVIMSTSWDATVKKWTVNPEGKEQEEPVRRRRNRNWFYDDDE
ncbi:WD repeat domain 23 [Planoprotostelium fungivorum]|uniref:WD repeat domain 23 n=1 Tax=Planoprotostelium fungivorum TaxID=1890364 RepID=A0A2P6NAE7_9EUKA|nr:WD repeat domain 23 [Planoprotostelium fungivorum]